MVDASLALGVETVLFSYRVRSDVGVRIERSLVIHFFFQAEDGIRDLTVTGVQTCALPISTRPVMVRPTSEPSTLANSVRPALRLPSRSLAMRSLKTSPPQPPIQVPHTLPASKIGRASCRERG